MNTFLRTSRERFLAAAKSAPKLATDASPRPTSLIAIGNEAGDMDSVVSSLATAFGLDAHSRLGVESTPFGTNESQYKPIVTAVMPFNRDELRLRQDVVFLFDLVGIDSQNLIYWDDVMAHNNWGIVEGLILLDHNNPSAKVRTRLPGPIVGIVDHHNDDGMALDAPLREIDDSSGSASCGVARLLLDSIKLDPTASPDAANYLPPEIVTMILSATVLDTRNFDPDSHKYNDRDIEITERLKMIHGSFDPPAAFADLHNARFNVTGFSVLDLLKLDYKHLSAPTSDGSVIQIGFSSIMDTALGLLGRTSNEQQLLKDMQTYASDLGLDILVAMCKKDKSVKRKGAIFVCKQEDVSSQEQIQT